MVSLWIPCEFPHASVMEPPMVSQWISFGILIDCFRMYHGPPMNSHWIRYGVPMDSQWIAGFPMDAF